MASTDKRLTTGPSCPGVIQYLTGAGLEQTAPSPNLEQSTPYPTTDFWTSRRHERPIRVPIPFIRAPLLYLQFTTTLSTLNLANLLLRFGDLRIISENGTIMGALYLCVTQSSI